METSEFNRKSVPNIIAAWAGLLTGPSVMVAATQSFFVLPWGRAFDLSRSAVSLILSVSPIIIAISVPLAGRAMDRWGLRPVLIPGVFAFGVMQFVLSLATTAWELVGATVLLSVAAAVTATVGYSKLISLWFGRHRGAVLGVCVALGVSVGQTAMPHLVKYLIDVGNWRLAYRGIGAVILLVGFPLILLLMREPKRAVAATAPAGAAITGITRAEALKKPAFWILGTAIFLGSTSLFGTTTHAVPMLLERGFTPTIAADTVSLLFAGGIFGQFTVGFVADRFNTPRITIPYFASAWIGLMVLHSASHAALLLAGAFILGLGLGAETAMAAYLTSRYFGLRDFSSIYGLFFASSSLGVFFGINLMGKMHDVTGSYDIMRYIFGVTMGTAVLLISSLGPYAYARRQAAEGESARKDHELTQQRT